MPSRWIEDHLHVLELLHRHLNNRNRTALFSVFHSRCRSWSLPILLPSFYPSNDDGPARSLSSISIAVHWYPERQRRMNVIDSFCPSFSNKQPARHHLSYRSTRRCFNNESDGKKREQIDKVTMHPFLHRLASHQFSLDAYQARDDDALSLAVSVSVIMSQPRRK